MSKFSTTLKLQFGTAGREIIFLENCPEVTLLATLRTRWNQIRAWAAAWLCAMLRAGTVCHASQTQCDTWWLSSARGHLVVNSESELGRRRTATRCAAVRLLPRSDSQWRWYRVWWILMMRWDGNRDDAETRNRRFGHVSVLYSTSSRAQTILREIPLLKEPADIPKWKFTVQQNKLEQKEIDFFHHQNEVFFNRS